ncbi:MAG TPA: GNAT family N-acetyltransferase [Candidatus Polarisedimenticolia bacterium]|nr:GNAT family N-acetyltransferase [Candidatus Polarisedimenticolia bacterium]
MRVVWPVGEDFWWEVARACPEATFFHTPLWHRLIERSLPPCRDATAGFVLEGGLRAVLPLLEVARPIRGIFRELVSTFGGCYGGVIAEGAPSAVALEQAWKAVLGSGRLARLQLAGNPLSAGRSPWEDQGSTDDFTQMIDLTPGFDAVERGFSESCRRHARKAREAGVVVEAARDEGSYRSYYEVYEDSLKRWGAGATSRYPWRLLEAGRGLSLDHPGTMELWTARQDGRMAAGAWVFYWNRHAVYWHGATRADALALSPGHLLHARIIEDACARGLAWYDFNPSGGHEGVARFKSGFGARPHRVARREVTGRLYSGASALVRALRG